MIHFQPVIHSRKENTILFIYSLERLKLKAAKLITAKYQNLYLLL